MKFSWEAGQGGGANGGVAQLDDVAQLSHGNHEARSYR